MMVFVFKALKVDLCGVWANLIRWVFKHQDGPNPLKCEGELEMGGGGIMKRGLKSLRPSTHAHLMKIANPLPTPR